MIEIKILVTVQVDPDGEDKKFTKRQLRDAAIEAVQNAVKMGEDVGFIHELAGDVSIGVAGVEAVK